MERMSAILTALRAAPPHTLAGERVTRVRDYLGGLDGLPASDVLELRTAHVKVIVRPSGTEPKLKLYYSAHARTMAEAAALCAAARRDMSASATRPDRRMKKGVRCRGQRTPFLQSDRFYRTWTVSGAKVRWHCSPTRKMRLLRGSFSASLTSVLPTRT